MIVVKRAEPARSASRVHRVQHPQDRAGNSWTLRSSKSRIMPAVLAVMRLHCSMFSWGPKRSKSSPHRVQSLWNWKFSLNACANAATSSHGSDGPLLPRRMPSAIRLPERAPHISALLRPTPAPKALAALAASGCWFQPSSLSRMAVHAASAQCNPP